MRYAPRSFDFMGVTAIILSRDEIAALPQAKRPLNCRLPEKLYTAIFETVGRASVCWTPMPPNCVFDTNEAGKAAIDLCFLVAAELERLGVDPKLINDQTPPLPS